MIESLFPDLRADSGSRVRRRVQGAEWEAGVEGSVGRFHRADAFLCRPKRMCPLEWCGSGGLIRLESPLMIRFDPPHAPLGYFLCLFYPYRVFEAPKVPQCSAWWATSIMIDFRAFVERTESPPQDNRWAYAFLRARLPLEPAPIRSHFAGCPLP